MTCEGKLSVFNGIKYKIKKNIYVTRGWLPVDAVQMKFFCI